MSKTPIIHEINQYIAEINSRFKQGNATEHTYRSALQRLLENMTSGLTVTNEPKRIACGAPDYIVTRKEIPVGYIEAKDIDENLNDKKHKKQFDRYKYSLNNLIITDYLTFQLFENGDFITSVTIARTEKNGIRADETQFELFIGLIDRFVGYEGESILTSANLSKIMAAKARLLANIIEKALIEDENLEEDVGSSASTILGQLQGFREVLIDDMESKEFADIYAQTIAYGMFAARLHDELNERFTRFKAAQLIPNSNPFLRQFFQYIAGYDLDERIRWIVDDLADLFNHVDIFGISKEFDKTDHDPMVHFYETFLAEYDPALRKSRGVWYTPQPVVKFIVQVVDEVLKQDFELSEGLADTSKVKLQQPLGEKDGKLVEKEYHKVQILDPATGTGTFLAEVVQNIYQRFKSNKGMWQSYADEHLIPRINGFEILMASYAMAHLKLDMLLQKTGHTSPDSSKGGGHPQRLRIFLTNSLDEARANTKAHLAQWLSNEANEANHIKHNVPVMVVLGNPPYSGESQNSGEWIMKQIEQYKREPQYQFKNRSKKEKNIPDTKWINNDYVKFIRFGQHFIEKNGVGVLAYITDNSFLDSLSFRGMRYNLMHTFDKIFILNLHGNSLKKETAPDGSKDENVFDIMQGVSINIFVKTCNNKGINPLDRTPATVFYYDLYGKREDKYSFLLNNDLQKIEWKELQPPAPNYFFVPKDFSLQEEYEKGFKIDELFSKKSDGIVTAKDAVFINGSTQEVKKNIKDFFNINPDENLIHKISYRPFDNQYIYYDTKKLERARKEIMQHLINCENICLIVSNQCESDWRYVFVSKIISEFNLTGTARRLGAGKVFPLYLYPENDNQTRSYDNVVSNLKPEVVKVFADKIGLQFDSEKKYPPLAGAGGGLFTPIDIFDYIYAVLHSPTYRERYKEFLKIDFPRVPYPENVEQFWKLAELGGKLRRFHLMEDIEQQDGIAAFNIIGSDEIEKPYYSPPCMEGWQPQADGVVSAQAEGGRVYINDTQYFDNVPLVAWNFYIGGYQPAQKWLKDRKGSMLNFEDIRHYQKMIWVLRETGEVMREVDEVFALMEGGAWGN